MKTREEETVRLLDVLHDTYLFGLFHEKIGFR
jgi:hypothetical protein